MNTSHACIQNENDGLRRLKMCACLSAFSCFKIEILHILFYFKSVWSINFQEKQQIPRKVPQKIPRKENLKNSKKKNLKNFKKRKLEKRMREQVEYAKKSVFRNIFNREIR